MIDSEKILEEAVRRVRGNLCIRVGKGSGGGFTSCSMVRSGPQVSDFNYMNKQVSDRIIAKKLSPMLDKLNTRDTDVISKTHQEIARTIKGDRMLRNAVMSRTYRSYRNPNEQFSDFLNRTINFRRVGQNERGGHSRYFPTMNSAKTHAREIGGKPIGDSVVREVGVKVYKTLGSIGTGHHSGFYVPNSLLRTKKPFNTKGTLAENLVEKAVQQRWPKGTPGGRGGQFKPKKGGMSQAASGAGPTIEQRIQKIMTDPFASPFEKKNAKAIAEVEEKIAVELATKGTSASRHTDANGNYTAERTALHRKILNEMDNPNAKSQEKPTVIFFGGLPGSGKSSSIGATLGMGDKGNKNSFAANAVILDPDAIKGKLPEFKGYNAAVVHDESSMLAKALGARAMAAKKNVIVDGTFKNPKKMGKRIEEFKKAGYRVEIRFAELPIAKSRERSMRRFIGGGETGRYVPAGFIQSLKIGNSSKNRQAFNLLKNKADGFLAMSTDVKFGDPAIELERGGKLI